MRFDRRKTYPLNDRKDESYARRIADFLPFITKIPYRKGGVVKVTPGAPINRMVTRYWPPTLYKFSWNRFTSGGASPSFGSTPATKPEDEPTPPPTGGDFVTKWNTSLLPLPMKPDGVYDFEVDWGDGTSDTITSFDDAKKNHTYVERGIWTVTISGQFDGFRFGANQLIALSLVEIVSFGSLRMTMSQTVINDSFIGAGNMIITATDVLDTSQIFSLTNMFRDCFSLTTVNLAGMGTGKISYGAMFWNCGLLEKVDTSDWDTSSCQNIGAMFFGCHVLRTTGCSTWTDLGGITSLQDVFNSCNALEETDFSGWVLGKLENMNTFINNNQVNADIICSGPGWDMSECILLNGTFIGFTGSVDVTGWDLPLCRSMFGTFQASPAMITELTPIGIETWTNVGAAGPIDMASTWSGCSNLVSAKLPWPAITVQITTAKYLAGNCGKLETLDLSGFDFSTCISMEQMCGSALSLSTLILGPGWNTSLVETMSSMFLATSLIPWTTLSPRIAQWDITSLANAQQILTTYTPGEQAISNSEYDLLLDITTGWPSQVFLPAVQFAATNAKYTVGGNAEAGRNALVAAGWNMLDGGPVTP